MKMELNPNLATEPYEVRLTPGLSVRVITTKVTHSGYILLDNGIEELAKAYGATIETEYDEWDGIPVMIKSFMMEGVEIIQIDERDAGFSEDNA